MALSDCRTQVDSQGRELVRHGTALFPVACYYDDLTREAVPWHWHEELEAGVVTQGRLLLSVGQEKAELSAGNGFFVNAGVLHGARNLERSACRIHSVVFHPRLVGGSMDSIFWQRYLTPLLSAQSREGVFLFPETDWQAQALTAAEQAWQSCVREGSGYEFSVREALSRLVLLLDAHLNELGAQPPSEKFLRDSQRLKQMLQYVQEHYAEPITVQQLSASALISASECLRCFHSTIGSTPIQYVKEVRVQQAAQLLHTTRLPVAVIAQRCGFQELSYFARAFRASQGCSPTEYRRREQEERAHKKEVCPVDKEKNML